MESETPENGLEELIRLSDRMTQGVENTAKQETKNKQELVEKRQVLQGLREITFSTTLEQLKTVSAESDILEKVNSFKTKQGTDDLRNLIEDFLFELEGKIRNISRSNPQLASFETSIKTLSVLIELFFSLK